MALLRVSYGSLLSLELRVSSHFFFFWFHVHAEMTRATKDAVPSLPPLYTPSYRARPPEGRSTRDRPNRTGDSTWRSGVTGSRGSPHIAASETGGLSGSKKNRRPRCRPWTTGHGPRKKKTNKTWERQPSGCSQRRGRPPRARPSPRGQLGQRRMVGSTTKREKQAGAPRRSPTPHPHAPNAHILNTASSDAKGGVRQSPPRQVSPPPLPHLPPPLPAIPPSKRVKMSAG